MRTSSARKYAARHGGRSISEVTGAWSHELEAIVMGEFKLRRLKGVSFETDNPASLCRWQGRQDFVYSVQVPGPHEFARMERAGELVVVYDTGKVVCQGSQQDILILLLEKAAREHTWPM